MSENDKKIYQNLWDAVKTVNMYTGKEASNQWCQFPPWKTRWRKESVVQSKQKKIYRLEWVTMKPRIENIREKSMKHKADSLKEERNW